MEAFREPVPPTRERLWLRERVDRSKLGETELGEVLGARGAFQQGANEKLHRLSVVPGSAQAKLVRGAEILDRHAD